VFWVISVYFNIRNTLPKSGTFPLGHPVYELLLHIFSALSNIHLRFIPSVHFIPVGRDSSVGEANCYGLDGPGSNAGGGEIFRNRPDSPWGPPGLVQNWYQVIPVGKTARAWHWPPIPSSAEVKESVELYLYSPSGTSWAVLGRNVHLNHKQVFKCTFYFDLRQG